MFILDCTQHISQTHKCDILVGDGYGGTYRRRRSTPPQKAETDGQKTTLREGFNAHSITMPNGCVITVNESGEVYMTEQGGAPRKMRHKDAVVKNMIK